MKQLFLVFATGLTLASCNESQGGEEASSADTTSSISTKVSSKELNETFDQAWNNRDTVKLFSLLSDDVQMLSGPRHLDGKQEVIEKFIRKDLSVTSNLKTNIVSSGEDANIAYESGTFALDVNVPGMKPFTNKGNYNFVWKKSADNAWKVSAINMEDLPVEKE